MLTSERIEKVRARFKIFRSKTYLNSCSQGALSDAVEAACHAYLETWHQKGSPWDEWVETYEALRTSFAQFIGASSDEIAITTSASAAISSVASALDFGTRRKVVMGEFEFPTMGHVWLAQRSRGVDVQFVAAEGNRIPLGSYAEHVDRNTLIVPVTRVCFMNGFRSDVAGLVKVARAQGAMVMLDDYQDCGTRPVDVKALGVDFYITGALKYLLGVTGIAFLYVRKGLIESLDPTCTGWFAQRNPFAFDPKLHDPSPSARRFEFGSPPIPNVYLAAAGIRLLQEIGLETVSAQVHGLTAALLKGAAVLGLPTKTPADSTGPLVVIESANAGVLVQKLAEQNIVVSSRHDGLRVSFHVYNTLADVEAVLDVLKKNLDLVHAGSVTAPSQLR